MEKDKLLNEIDGMDFDEEMKEGIITLVDNFCYTIGSKLNDALEKLEAINQINNAIDIVSNLEKDLWG